MKTQLYKVWLLVLRCLVYVKRGVVRTTGWFLHLNERARAGYRETLGIQVYKVVALVRKSFAPLRPGEGRLREFIGGRGVLQLLFFLLAVGLLIPFSRLYTKDDLDLLGHDTLLYRLAGPGNEILESEEVLVFAPEIRGRSWRDGSLSTDGTTIHGTNYLPEPSELGGVSAGGTALTKPNILSGSSSTPALPRSGQRTTIVLHTVQPGDVVALIAKRYGVTVETILWANNLTARSYIRPGDVLKILPTSGLMHKVVRGDTVGKIARTYQAKEADIVQYNRLQKDGSDIIVGEELIVPGGVRVQPVAIVRATPTRSPLSSIVAPPPSIEVPAGGAYVWPAGVRRITQYFGLRHTGLDIAGPVGTSIYAVQSGVISRSQCGWNGGYGCYVIIDHGNGVSSLYGHASQLLVEVGEAVEQGQSVALMGSTGRSTGPHVHFEVRVNGRQTNPLRYVR